MASNTWSLLPSPQNAARTAHVFLPIPCSNKLCRFHMVHRNENKRKIHFCVCISRSSPKFSSSESFPHFPCKYLSSSLFILHPWILILAIPIYSSNILCLHLLSLGCGLSRFSFQQLFCSHVVPSTI